MNSADLSWILHTVKMILPTVNDTANGVGKKNSLRRYAVRRCDYQSRVSIEFDLCQIIGSVLKESSISLANAFLLNKMLLFHTSMKIFEVFGSLVLYKWGVLQHFCSDRELMN